jgi:hypothetical protein
MIDRVNLADPDVEPTDEQLIGLSTRAFAGVARAHAVALERLRAQIAVERASLLGELATRRAAVSRESK